MDAQIIDLNQWKAAHPPALVMLQAGARCALQWQALWFSCFSAAVSAAAKYNQKY